MNNNTPNYNFLYQQKCEEYDMLNDEYQEMKGSLFDRLSRVF